MLFGQSTEIPTVLIARLARIIHEGLAVSL
jgi:hypothetical protein